MIERTLGKTIRHVSKSFPVLLLTGPRQVGKTTLLAACAEQERGYVTLDDLEQRELARNDPALFLQAHPPPLIIDEIQYAPQLFGGIKMAVDRGGQTGMFWLTGSQKFHLMKGISESLAGRVAIIDLLGFSQAEREGRAEEQEPFRPTAEWLQRARARAGSSKNVLAVYQDIWLGSYPRMVLDRDMSRDLFYNSYVQTYIQRDVREAINLGDSTAFARFLRAVAARTGQLLNYSDLARDVDIDHKTAKSWLAALETSGLVYLLPPYHSNLTKRLVKTPKLYFLDTGLCSYLTRWPSPEALEAGAMSGAIFETYLLAEILKSYWHNGKSAYLYYYRDLDQKEVDLLLEEGDTLYPVELKKSASPAASASRHFSVLARLKREIGHGAVICLRETDVPLSREVDAVPVGYL
ncbi:MAG: ATP-binding protein [Thermodesulfobacteriota bacterium]